MAKEEILIRCLQTLQNGTEVVRMKYPNIANNHLLMTSGKCKISDPQYDAKMEAIKMNKPFSENGKAKDPIRESFASPVILAPEVNIEQPKNEIEAPVIIGEKVKRTRRTKEQMQSAKQTTKTNSKV